jgi:hypothetical protein
MMGWIFSPHFKVVVIIVLNNMRDRDTLNAIYETVYQKSVPQRESFFKKYDRSDNRLLESDSFRDAAHIVSQRKANDIYEVLSITRKKDYEDNTSSQTVDIEHRIELDPVEFEDTVFGNFFKPPASVMAQLADKRGWAEIYDISEDYPPVYVNTEGFNYIRYAGVAEEDFDDWLDLVDGHLNECMTAGAIADAVPENAVKLEGEE